MKNQVVRGCAAEHILTGQKGTVTSKSIALNGNVQFLFRPEGNDKDGMPLDDSWYDDGWLKYSGPGISEDSAEPVDTDIEHGDHVKHLSGFEGIVTERVEYFNGCVTFGVCPKVKESNVAPEIKYFACQYLSVVAKGEKKKKSDTGGPSTMAPGSPSRGM